MEGRDPLDVVIARAIREDSVYWYSRDLQGTDPNNDQLVEARLNIRPEKLATFSSPPTWRIHRIDPDGIVYLRRSQPLTDAAITAMITEMISLAYASDGQFWSWIHGDLTDA